jgi:hypothetical protein
MRRPPIKIARKKESSGRTKLLKLSFFMRSFL